MEMNFISMSQYFGLRYNHVNNALLWLANQRQYKATLFLEHIFIYRTIVKFCNSALFKRGPKIATAAR